MKDLAIMLLSLGVILMSAEAFTNGVEWLGKRLRLSAGAVGSILAAVGTALPETMVPIIAFLGNNGDAAVEEVGTGAILGAPFMLATLAFFISGVAVLVFRRNNKPLFVNTLVIRRDISFFLILYSFSILASFLPTRNLKLGVACILPILYGIYVIQTVRSSHDQEEHGILAPLYIARRSQSPTLFLILSQLTLALLGIIAGAHAFVDAVHVVALATGIPVFVLALIITPLATELPEKFNSVIWLRRGKDTLALGNITGAMVFQSSLIPAIGISLSPWQLDSLGLWSAVLALGSGLFIFSSIRRTGTIRPSNLIAGGVFYLLFILTIIGFPQLR